MGHIFLPKKRAVTSKTKNLLFFWRNFVVNHNQPNPKPCQNRQNHSIYGISVTTSHWLTYTVNQNIVSRLVLFYFQFRLNQPDSQRRSPVISQFCSRFRNSECNRPPPEEEKNSQRSLLSSRDFLLSQKHDFLKKQLARLPIISNHQATKGL